MSLDISNFVNFSYSIGIQNYVRTGSSIIFYYPCTETFNCGPISVFLSRGEYLLEVWGAEGGDNNNNILGGAGGFSSGIFAVSRDTTLFLYVGGKGEVTDTASSRGGYNGGGAGNKTTNNNYHGGGGGSTDFRVTNSIYSRILVAGGGGGAGWRNSENSFGGYAGGSIAGNGNSSSVWYGYGATIYGPGMPGCYNELICAKAGEFFYGGIASHGGTSPGGGGGSGYYGGGGGHCAGGGGGSGYFGSLKNGKTISGNQYLLNPAGGNELGHHGNGAAKITIIGMFRGTLSCDCTISHLLTYLQIFMAFIMFNGYL